MLSRTFVGVCRPWPCSFSGTRWREFLQVLHAKAVQTADTATLFLRQSFGDEKHHFDREAMNAWIDATWTTYLKEDGWTFSPRKREVGACRPLPC